MKGLIKFSSVALAVLAMASCADDLGFVDNSDGKITDTSKLIGVLGQTETTRTGMVNWEDSKNNKNKAFPAVWTANDKVNVYSLKDALTYAVYELESGAGSQKATFKEPPYYKDGIHDILDTSQDLYAVTSSPWVYGVSATMKDYDGEELKDEDGNLLQKALLTVEIPKAFDWYEDNAADHVNQNGSKSKYYYNDAPYWGHVTGTTAGQMNVDFKSLTGAIKIDAALLPKGTKAIVVATEDAAMPLSGTFHSILDLDYPDDCALVADKRLVNYNQIRADFTALDKQFDINDQSNTRVFIVPLICGIYKTLDVIAILEDEFNEDGTPNQDFNGEQTRVSYIPSKGDVTYRGMQYNTMAKKGDWVRIKKWEWKDGQKVTNKTVLEAYPAVEQDLYGLTPMQISERIALAYDGRHDFIFNIRNIKMDNSYSVVGDTVNGTKLKYDNTIYIPKNKDNDGYRVASITINFADKSLARYTSDPEYKNTTLYFKEANYNGEDFHINMQAEGGISNHTNPDLRIPDTRGGLIGTHDAYNWAANNRAAWRGVSGGQTAEKRAGIETAESPSGIYTRKVNINLNGTNDMGKIADVDIYLPTSRVTLNNFEKGTKYGMINGQGDVYGKVTIVAEQTNNINNENGIAGVNVVGNYKYVSVLKSHKGGVIVKGTNAEAKYVTVDNLDLNNPTTGLVKIDDASVAKIEYVERQTTDNAIYTVGSAAIKEIIEKDGNKIKVRAFWTGKKLEQGQINDEYDQTNIYTAAQLASMGSVMTIGAKTNVANYTYNIVKEKIAWIHLGGVEFPWNGAEINAGDKDFTLQANGTGLQNMKLNSKDEVTSHGLISSIVANNVTINDINLYQAKLDKSAENVGAVVGSIVAKGAVEFGGSQNAVDEIDFTSAEDNVGGLVGSVKAASVNFSAANLDVKIENVEGKNNVGGLAGYVETSTGDAKMNDNTVATVEVTGNGNIAAKGNNVGGAFGEVCAEGGFRIWSKLTVKANGITAGGYNAGGVAGHYDAKDAASFGGGNSNSILNVTAKTISATGFLGDVEKGEYQIAGNVGGLVGHAERGTFNVATTSAVNVKVTENLASICNVGGLVGLCNVEAKINGKRTGAVTVDVKKFKNTIGNADKYDSQEKKLAIGTFGGMVGKSGENLTILEKDYNRVSYDTSLFSVAERKAMYFDKRVAEEVNVNKGKNVFWGDNNNYLGLGAEGIVYTIAGSKQREGSDFNVYVASSTYPADSAE